MWLPALHWAHHWGKLREEQGARTLARSKNHAGRAADTYLKLRDWEGEVSVLGPDMAAGILEVFHWCVLRVLAQKRERWNQDENLAGCRLREASGDAHPQELP